MIRNRHKVFSLEPSDGLLSAGGGCLAANRRCFPRNLVPERLLDSHFLAEALERVSPIEPLKLLRGVLVQEFVNREETSTDLDLDLASLHLHHDLTGSKLVDSLRLTHEHDLQLLSLWVVVEVLSKLRVNLVSLNWNVDGNPGSEIENVLLENLNLSSQLFHVVPVPLLFFAELLEYLKG